MAFKTLNIGALSLMNQQMALTTVGQNISNASTPGYSRQRLMMEAAPADQKSFGALGSGVLVKSIARVADEFLEKQVRIAKSSKDYLDTLQDGYENLEVFFNELTEHDLSTSMNGFWDAIGDFSNNVEDVSTRRAVLERGRSMIDTFSRLEGRMLDYRERMNEAIVDGVTRINTIVKEISELNQQIVRTESGGTTGVVANDLRDQRGERMKELSGMLDITVTEESDGSMTISQKSRLLVYKREYYELDTRQIFSEDMLVDVPVFEADEEEVLLGDGELAGMVSIRDDLLLNYKRSLDQLAGSMIWEFNRLHSQGIGLKGYSTITARQQVTDPENFLDEIGYGFTPMPDTYQIQNGNFEIVVHNEGSDEETILNIEIDLDDVGTYDPDGPGPLPAETDDTIFYDPANPTDPRSLVNKIQTALDDFRPGAFTVSLDLQNHLTIESNSDEFTFGFGRDTSGVLAALGLNTFFEGYDGGTIDIDETMVQTPDMVAGARHFVPGDNSNAMRLLELRETGVLDNDTASFDDYYEGIVNRLGVEGARIDSLLETQEDILIRMENQREDLSGVNIDEELTKMIQYQRSFQSAARFITTADSILEALINM